MRPSVIVVPKHCIGTMHGAHARSAIVALPADPAESAAGAAVRDLQVVLPAGVSLVQLKGAAECVAVVTEAAGEALAKPRVVSPDLQLALLRTEPVDAEHPARVEVVHRQAVRAVLGVSDHR